jgi:hypothetical protein
VKMIKDPNPIKTDCLLAQHCSHEIASEMHSPYEPPAFLEGMYRAPW